MKKTLTEIRHLAYNPDVSLYERREIEKCLFKLLHHKKSIWSIITSLNKGNAK